MIGTIVIGYDGSEEAGDALALAIGLARANAAELVVAVIDEFHVFAGAPPAEQQRIAAVEEAFDHAAAHLGDHDFRRETLRGSVPECLELIAGSTSADLVVVGSTRRGEVGRVVPGSVGDRLLAGSPCAVAIAPRGYAARDRPEVRRIGVGFDGEAESMEAARYGRECAVACGAGLELVAVSPEPKESLTGLSWGVSGPYLGFLHRRLESEIEKASNALHDGFECRGSVLHGDPADVLIERSAELDLLILGSRGYGPLRRVLLGSVSSRVAHGSACPVLVIPRSARKPRAGELDPRATGQEA